MLSKALVLSILVIILCIDNVNSCGLNQNEKVRNAITAIISSWYFTNVDILTKGVSRDEFNEIIPKIFDCSDNNELDICIATQDDCSAFQVSTCDQFADKDNGFYARFAETFRGTTWGQVCLCILLIISKICFCTYTYIYH